MEGDSNKEEEVGLLYLLGRLWSWTGCWSLHVLFGLERGSQQTSMLHKWEACGFD
jgi:hypothetical protein